MACPSCRSPVERGALVCPACGHALRRLRSPALWPWALLGLAAATAGLVARARAPVGARPVPAEADAAMHGTARASATDPPRGGEVTGTLRLALSPPAEVELDGRALGTVGTREIQLRPGPHRLRVVHPTHPAREHAVVVPADGAVDLVVDLAASPPPPSPPGRP